MKYYLLCLIFCFALHPNLLASRRDHIGHEAQYKNLEIIIKFKPFAIHNKSYSKSTSSSVLRELAHQNGIKYFRSILPGIQQAEFMPKKKLISKYGLDRIYIAKLVEGSQITLAVEVLNQLAAVEYAEPNYLYAICKIPNDPEFYEQWAFNQQNDHDLNAPESWNIEHENNEIIIGVIDTGIDITHPDLAENIWVNRAEIPNNDSDDDGNSYVDDIHGWDFSDDDNNPLPEVMLNAGLDYGWHGTHCAGIAGAVTNNDLGIAGMAWNCSIMPIKIFPNAYSSVIAKAILYAVHNGAQILSGSWGGYFFSNTIRDALDYAAESGVVSFFAAGNSNTDLPLYPAACSSTIAVAATNPHDQKARFSNYGNWVDLCSPGVDILSTAPTNYGHYPPYFYQSGTSMSVPFAVGAAALLKSKYPELSPEQIRARLKASADYIDSDYALGAGRINCYRALTEDLDAALSIAINALPGGRTNTNYFVKLKAKGGTPPYYWQCETDPCLPEGLTFDSLGFIKGVPKAALQCCLRLSVSDASGIIIKSDSSLSLNIEEVMIITQTNRAENSGLPESGKGAVLLQNSPNPFNPATKISFTLQQDAIVCISIYNIIGRKIKTLTHAQYNPGKHELVWNGTDDDNLRTASGIYFLVLQTPQYRTSRKMMLLD